MKALLHFHIHDRDRYARWVFGYFILLLIYRIHCSTLLISAYGQPIKDPQLDHSFWLSMCLGFPHYIIHHYYACLFVDCAVVLLSLACFLSVKNRALYCTLLLIFFFIHRVTIETFSCSHTKSISCVFIALLPFFCFKDDTDFKHVIEFGRYLLIFILVSASYHKFCNGELLAVNNFATVLVNQHSDLATLNPGHISYRIASVLIEHPTWAYRSYILLFLTQLTFISGIFTKRLDRILFILLLGFAVSTYFIMRIYNFDILMLGLTLLFFPVSEKQVKKTQILA